MNTWERWPGTRWCHDVARDVRFSARLLLKDRRFTLVAVLALALGVGANNTLFTVVNAICIRGLSVADVDRLVDVSNRGGSGRPMPLSIRQFEDLVAARPPAIDAFAAYATRPATLRDEQSAAERIAVAHISTNAFALIRQPPLLGRAFRDDDGRPGAPLVAILGAHLWRARYGADREAIGQVLKFDGVAVSIVGVMPDGFRFPDNADAWRPLAAFQAPPDARALGVYGRLAAGATVAEARESIAAAIAHAPSSSDTAGPVKVVAVPINDRYVGDITNPAWIVFITVGLLLVVIACSNVANLLLARGARRGKEMAVRLSLGATRLRIVRQLLVEGAMLAVAGGAGAIAVSSVGNRLLSAAIPPGGLPYWVTLTMDARVAVALSAVCLGAVLLFGLAPALHLSRTSASAIMKETAAGTSHDRGAARWTWLFLTCQLALTVMLLSKLDFTVRSYLEHQSRDPVVDARRFLTFSIALPPDTYAEPERRVAFYRALGDRLRSRGPWLDMSVANALPFSGAMRPFAAEDRQLADGSPRARTVTVDASYFQTLGLDVIEGRTFGELGTTADRDAIIVNQRFAALFFPGQDALGRRIRVGAGPGAAGAQAELKTVVGIVPSIREDSTVPAEPAAYLPIDPASMGSAVVLVREAIDAARLAPAVRDAVRRIDPGVAVNKVMTLADVNWNSRWNPRVAAGIVITLAVIALALATLGLAAVTAYAVAERSRELGIRLALGATGVSVVTLMLKRVAIQAGVGVAVGALLAKAWDPTIASYTVAAAALVVVAVVLGTSAWPAARAARIDPLTMLREP
jgi:putative ABC transport system permease protein